MSNWKVLVSSVHLQREIGKFLSLLSTNGCEVVVPPVIQRLDEENLLSLLGDVDGVIAGDDVFTEKVMLSAPRLRVISKWGTGIDSIDLQAAARLNIRVFNTANAFSEPVADSVLGYILSFARQLPTMDATMKEGRWEQIPAFCLEERTLGVIGVGSVGKAVVRRARAFGMRLLGNDTGPIEPGFVKQTGLEVTSLEQLLREADFVSLNCDLNPTSYRMIDDSALRLMKPTAVVINTARGSLIEEAALISALEKGLIGGAALDVFEREPLPKDSPLLGMKQVLLAPHNANSSVRHKQLVHEKTVRNLLIGLGAINQ